MNEIGKRIYELRLKNDLSQDALAEKLGVSRQAVSKWENQMSMPETDKLVMMSEIFGVSLDCLIKGVACDEGMKEFDEHPSGTAGFSSEKLRQIMGIIFVAAGIIGLLLGMLYHGRVLFQFSPLFIVLGLMLIYIKRNAHIWCTGLITLLTLIFGRYMLHSFVYMILLTAEFTALAVMFIAKKR